MRGVYNEKSVQCRYVAVKYSGIVKNTASDELKAKVTSSQAPSYARSCNPKLSLTYLLTDGGKV